MVKILKKASYEQFYEVNERVAQTSPMATHYHSSNPFERWLWQQKKNVIHSLLKELPLKSVVDLGCGDGGLIEAIDPHVQYTGVDISPTQIEHAKEKIKQVGLKHARVLRGDIMNLRAIKDNSFDAALVCDVVEHVLSPDKLFKEVKRIVKQDGHVIFSIPNEFLWELARALLLRFPLRSPDHINAVYPADIRERFPNIVKQVFLPINFSPTLSLIHIFLVKNVT